MVPFFPLSPLAYLFPHFSRIPAVKHSVENASCRAHSQKKLCTERLGDIYVYSPADACGKCLINAGAFVSNAARAF